jgi:hypothetical protein
VPPEGIHREDAAAALARSAAGLAEVARLEARLPRIAGRIRHFAFGLMTACQWLRMARIHTRHHLAIIADLLAPR